MSSSPFTQAFKEKREGNEEYSKEHGIKLKKTFSKTP